MLKNYVKVAWRNLVKNKTFSLINIGGLAIGIASAVLLLSFVAFQFSYDHFHANRKNIYRVNLYSYQNGKLLFKTAENYSALASALENDFPEIENATRLYNMGYKNNCVFTYQDIHFRETKFLYADASFLTIFSFPFLKGNPASALAEPFSAVISESEARKIFGSQDPMGKFIQMDDDDRNKELCKITGVFKDLPKNSHVQFHILISFKTLDQRREAMKRYESNWDRKDFYTYVLFRPGTDTKAFENHFASFIRKHIPEEKSQFKESRFTLQPLDKIHLSSENLTDEPEPTTHLKAMIFLIIIAFFIISIAWLNYINLTTADSINRAKEIGIRKVLGSGRKQLIRQFLTESLSINLISFFIALLLVYSFKSWLNRFFYFEFSFTDLFSNPYGQLFIGFMCLGAFLSGMYPAFVLSGFKPIMVLKGRMKSSPRGLAIRKYLVIFQFSLSIFLIIGTVIVQQQVNFMLHQNLGINVSQVMVMDRPGRWDTTRSMHNVYVKRFKESLMNNPSVEAVAMSGQIPGKEIRWPDDYLNKNKKDQATVPINSIVIDDDFLFVLGIHILAGRNFSKAIKSDNEGLIISESAVKSLGFKNNQDAVGKEIYAYNDPYQIVGIVNDFNQMSLQKKAEPVVFQFNGSDAREFEYYLVKVKSKNIRDAVRSVQNAWNESFKDNPYEFTFLDDFFNRQYKSDIQFGNLFGVFSIVAIAIACIGLIALVAFMVKQRSREIGVRKILGAGMQDIISLLTKEFARLVLLANLIAWPMGWLLMSNWLKDFAYRIHISLWVFIISGIVTLLIALCTIGFQAIKTAIENPVKSLRSE